MIKRQICNVICFILALLTVSSVAPAILHFWFCKFSSRCFVGVLWYFMMGPSGFHKLAMAVVLSPAVFLLLYVFAFLNCQRSRDILDRDDGAVF